MAERAVANVKAAMEAAEFLDRIGEHKRANDVRRVCRSNSSYRATMQTLYNDNMALRQLNRAPIQSLPYPKPRPERVTVRADLVEHAASLIADRDPKLSELFRRLSGETAYV